MEGRIIRFFQDESRQYDEVTAPTGYSGFVGTPASVLIVDDAPDTLELYGLYFEAKGLSVLLAADGAAALRQIETGLPDAVVMDLAMPGLTGWDVIQKLRANPRTRSLPIVAVSGQGAPESAIIDAGADAFCPKPCAPDQLVTKVLALLASC